MIDDLQGMSEKARDAVREADALRAKGLSGGASMKALSLWQPSAAAIALELKLWETRSWPTNYRGPLAIHAAKRPWSELDDWHAEASQRIYNRCLQLVGGCFPAIDPGHAKRASRYLHDRVLVFGSVLCIVDVVDCVPTDRLRGTLGETQQLSLFGGMA
jgi:hypothetical protein